MASIVRWLRSTRWLGGRGILADMANLVPVTLIVGEEEFLVDRAVREALSQARAALAAEIAAPAFRELHIAMTIAATRLEEKHPQMRIFGEPARYAAGEALQQAIIDGKTLNELSVRAGDRITISTQQQRSAGELLRLTLVGVPSVLFAISQIAGAKK